MRRRDVSAERSPRVVERDIAGAPEPLQWAFSGPYVEYQSAHVRAVHPQSNVLAVRAKIVAAVAVVIACLIVERERASRDGGVIPVALDDLSPFATVRE
jgi:hypothetical protein